MVTEAGCARPSGGKPNTRAIDARSPTLGAVDVDLALKFARRIRRMRRAHRRGHAVEPGKHALNSGARSSVRVSRLACEWQSA